MHLLNRSNVHWSLALVVLTACNDIPEGTVVGIEPGEAYTTDDLTAVILTPAVDRHDVSYTYEWSVDGSLSDETGEVISASLTSKGEVWTLIVTPDDGKDTGIAAEASVTILNTIPTATVELAPTAPTTVDDLVATVSGSDVDGDDVTFTYTWTRDGDVTPFDGDTVPAAETATGQTWEVVVVPNDGEEDGEAVAATITVVNEIPVADSVTVEPQVAYADSTFTAEAIGSDFDEDPLTWTYTWYVAGVEVASGSEATLSGVFAKGDEVVVEAVANDGYSDSNVVTSTGITVLNSAPSLEGASVDIAEPSTDSSLTCVAAGAADIDGDTVTTTSTWTVDGTDVGEHDVLDGSYFSKGQQVTCTLTPTDGVDAGEPVTSAAVSVLNTPPVLGGVSLTPSTARTGDTLGVETSGIVDLDDDSVSLTYSWEIGGTVVSTASTLDPSAHSKGDVVTVTVTPNDGEADGTPVSASLTIENTAPSASSVALEPQTAFVDSTFTAAPSGSDVDGDSLTWTYTWFVSGIEVASGTDATLTGVFAKGDEVVVKAVANDGTADSDVVTSAGVTVLNTAPSLEGATVDPSEPNKDDSLTCIASGADDLDGDSVSTTATWSVDGSDVGEHESLDSTFFSKGQQVTCTLTPTDGEDAGEPVTSSAVTVVNTPPVLGSIALTPSPARTGDTLGIETSGVADGDDDAVSFTYSWEIDGNVVSTESTLDSSLHGKGDVVEVTVTPNDGEEDGTPVSESLTIINTAPSAPEVTLGSDRPRVWDDLVCAISVDSVDADGDSISYTFDWFVDGSPYSGATSTTVYSGDTLPAAATIEGEFWSCTVVADDGTDFSSEATADEVEVVDRDGRVRTISGDWVDVFYERCGTGNSCNASDARAACSSKGMKVASHASNGSSTVYDLGATNSCQWSTSYFTNERRMDPNACLVGISNLDWSSCCTTSRWHGNTMPFGYTANSGSPDTVFGYVNSGNSGYVSSYPNNSGNTWGCQPLSTQAQLNSGCTTTYVACVP